MVSGYGTAGDGVHSSVVPAVPAGTTPGRTAISDPCLQGRRILVAEDEYLIAFDVRDALVRAGAEVLGPVPSVEGAAALMEREAHIDAAVLDVNLRGNLIFAVADMLGQRGVPVIFATGYDPEGLPPRFSGATRLEKPLEGREIAEVLAPLLARDAA